MIEDTLDATTSRIYIGGKVAQRKSDVVGALSHHPLSVWLDTPGYAGVLSSAPVGEYRVLLAGGKWVDIEVARHSPVRVR